MEKILNKKHSLWDDFIEKLEEKCNFTEDGKWFCKGNIKKSNSFTMQILCQYDDIDIKGTIEYLENHGGYCDCEILFNVVEYKDE